MRRISLVVQALLAILLAAVSVAYTLPSFSGWYFNDDMKNMRWVLEYRDAPWKALTELHAVQDHVRPFTLMATWLGAVISDGEWWGPHAVLVALFLAILAGTVALASRGTGALAAGVVAGAFALLLGGTAPILLWNAYMNTAGEVACGVWGLVAVHRALQGNRRAWAILAVILLISAGLFKEPGWVVYPFAAVAMGLSARDADQAPAKTWAWTLVLPVIGLAGLALTWHPANVTRYFDQSTTVGARVFDGLERFAMGMVGRWPVEPRMYLGIPAALVSLALWGDLLRPEPDAPTGGWRRFWVAPGLALAATWYAWPTLLVPTFFPLVAAVLVRRWRRPPPELVMLLLACGVMAPTPGVNAVHVVAGGVGLAAWCARTWVAWIHRSSWLRWPGGALLGLALVQMTSLARHPPAGGIDYGFKDCTYSLAAFVQTTEPQGIRLGLGQSEEARAATPAMPVINAFWPYFRDEVTIERAEPGAVRVWVDGVMVVLPRAELQDLRERNVLQGRAGDHDLPRGYYAAGITSDAHVAGVEKITLADQCKRTWTAHPPDTSAWASFTVVKLDDGCQPLTVTVEPPDKAAQDGVLLDYLVDPRFHLPASSVPENQRVLPVRSREVEAGISGP